MRRAFASVAMSVPTTFAATAAGGAARRDPPPPGDVAVARPDAPPAPPAEPANPRLKLSYVRFSTGNADGSAIPLQALHLDLYPLSRPWVRGGFSIEAGRGAATLLGNAASLQ